MCECLDVRQEDEGAHSSLRRLMMDLFDAFSRHTLLVAVVDEWLPSALVAVGGM